LFLFLATFSLEKALAQSLSLGSCYEKCGIYDSAAACQCDEKCIIYGDCCKDICTSCPRLSICLAPQLPAYPTGAAISIQPIITPRKCTSHNDCKNLICPQVIGMDTPCCNFNTGECYCGNKECSSTTTTIPIQICRDSDGGKNYYQRGYVIFSEFPDKYKWLYDYCSRNILTEYFCDGNTAKEENYTCPYGCENGACKSAETVITSTIPTTTTTLQLTTTTIPNSCKGRCEIYNPNAPCQCDAKCILRGDCCKDICIDCPNLSICQIITIPTTTTIPIQICRDSDGGKNYYQRGYVIFSEFPDKYKWLYDYCSRNILTEYFCDGNTAKEENYTCPYGCENGACKSAETVITSTIPTTTTTLQLTTTTIPNSCKGRCEIYNPNAPCQCDAKCILRGDCCKDICIDCPNLSICQIITIPTTTTIPIQICRDSDGGKNYYQRGYVTIIEGLKMKWLYDYCSRNILHEYFCDGITAKEENYTCLLDCINGACIRCRDSDHGNNYFVKGNCSYVKENEVVSKADYCASEEILIEYRCSEEGCVEERFNCSLLLPKVQTIFPIKYVCKEGACKIEQQPITTTTIPNSCEGRCGIYQRGAPCQCDAYCKRYGDCCKDFCEVCKNMPGC
jgi:hypothetical protein